MKEGLYTKKLKADRIICSLCHHQCMIAPGAKGLCGVRENKKGKLYALNYQKIVHEVAKPIETVLKHFLPGTQTYTVGTVGENFCEQEEATSKKATADQLVKRALRSECDSLTFMYNEPSMSFELVAETAKLARSHRLKTVVKTNLYVQDRPLKELMRTAHALLIELPTDDKAVFFTMTGAKLFPVQKNLLALAKQNVWFEILTDFSEQNGTPGQIQALASFISSLGDIPWHIHGDEEAVALARQVAVEKGLSYVYGKEDVASCVKCEKPFTEAVIKQNKCACKKKVEGVF
tara:strand:- start:2585 stop:3457 length:873 start_codon:yes stop_codon:yes gene_type:complete